MAKLNNFIFLNFVRLNFHSNKKNTMLSNLLFSLNAVAPVFLIISLGYFLKKIGMIEDSFIDTTSKVVFNVAMPALVFSKLATADFQSTFRVKPVLIAYFGTIAFFGIAWLIALLLTKDGKDQGAFIQASFRSNFAIVGFAIIFNMFGESGLSKAALLLAFVMPLYNILAVIALTTTTNQSNRIPIKRTIKEVITNPLIIAAFVAIPCALLHIKIPFFVAKSIDYLAAMTLPLALIGIGGSLYFRSIRKNFSLTFAGTAIKIIILPLILTAVTIFLDIRGEMAGVLFVLFASPTAIASFIMARAMGANSELAGNIVVTTTLGSILTISLGIFLLKSFSLI